ncbi:hypothetical protein ES707_14630 [subsurface metagenome]
MTLTNHTRRIEELAGAVTTLCDSRKYEEAHCALDDIEKKVRKLRRHIDHLQFVNYFDLRLAEKGD